MPLPMAAIARAAFTKNVIVAQIVSTVDKVYGEGRHVRPADPSNCHDACNLKAADSSHVCSNGCFRHGWMSV